MTLLRILLKAAWIAAALAVIVAWSVGLVTAGYTWARQAPWEGAGHGPFFKDFDHSGCRICAR
jgi:hypothetical protein